MMEETVVLRETVGSEHLVSNELIRIKLAPKKKTIKDSVFLWWHLTLINSFDMKISVK